VTRIEKPWGFEELIFVGDRYAFKKLFMLQGHACSLQFHVDKHETIYVVEGLLQFEVGPSNNELVSHELGPGSFWIIEPGTIHRMSALVDTLYLEASTPELSDVVRIEDLYGRA
jgi:mannose-6-phosphate isomerase